MLHIVPLSDDPRDEAVCPAQPIRGADDLPSSYSPSFMGRLLKGSMIASGLFSLFALVVGLTFFALTDRNERHKRFLTVHFFQHGLVRPDQMLSGWGAPDQNGIPASGNVSELRIPLKSELVSDVNLTIDFSYIKRKRANKAGQRVLRILANNEPISTQSLPKAQSRIETIRVPKHIARNEETMKLTLQSIPRDEAKASDGIVVLHSIMVYYD